MKQFLAFLWFLCVQILLGQTEEPTFLKPTPGDEVFASPSTMAFHKAEFVKTNLYTGRIELSIPIYTIKTGKISIPISIDYNSGGIRVDDIASEVGMGWGLKAGGSVMRVVRDLSDIEFEDAVWQEADEGGDNAGNVIYDILALGYHRKYAPYDYSLFPYSTRTYTRVPPHFPNKSDASPDQYIVSAPGINTSFYLVDSNPQDSTTYFENRKFRPTFVNNSGIAMDDLAYQSINFNKLGFTAEENGNPNLDFAILPGNSLTSSFNTHELTNINGVKYIFEKKEIVETLRTPLLGGVNQTSNRFKSHDARVSAWKIDKMIDLSTNNEVNFIYESYSNNNSEFKRSYMRSNNDEYYWFQGGQTYIHKEVYPPNSSVSIRHKKEIRVKYPRLQRLSSINWKQGKIDFIYNINRIDSKGNKALSSIIVKNLNDKIIKKIDFSYSYWSSKENCNTQECYRLFLDEVIDNTDPNQPLKHQLGYDKNTKLPKRTSSQTDFLGYYNNNGSSVNFDGYLGNTTFPELYFHPNQGQYSILPFPMKNKVSRKIHSGFSLTPNSSSLIGLLTKITYPTGGISQFQYENNRFNLLNEEYISGGARIKKQIISEENTSRELIYSYEQENSTKSSGFINNFPVYGFPNTDLVDINASTEMWDRFFTVFSHSSTELELTNGAFVGYSRVTETEIGNGKRIINFYSPKDYPNTRELSESSTETFLYKNSAFPGIHYVNNDLLQGNQKSEFIYDQNDKVLQKKTNTYQHKIFSSIPLRYGANVLNSIDPRGNGYYNFPFSSKINIERNLLSSFETVDNFNDHNLTKQTEFIYDPNIPLVIKSKSNFDDNAIIEKEYNYPKNPGDVFFNSVPLLISQNRLSELLQKKILVNNKPKELYQINYKQYYSNIILPEKLVSNKNNGELNTITTYNKYDPFGNVLEVSNIEGTNKLYIWGYNDSFPIAIVENAFYSHISSYVPNLKSKSNLDNDRTIGYLGNEGALRQALDDFRNAIPNGRVTTYTYDPLIGVTSKTGPNGYTIYYEYDDFNRLKFIKDADGNLISENKYKYKTN